MVIAQSEHSQTSTLLYSAFIWARDCFEWHQEATHDRDSAHQQLQVKQLEFEAINAELVQRREEITLFQQQFSRHAHRHIRAIQTKQDGDLDHYKAVTVSLQAQLTRREENVLDMRRANIQLKQEIAQVRTAMEQALDMATTQLEAHVTWLERTVRARAAKSRVRVLPALRSSTARIFKAWVERTVFQGQRRMVIRHQDLDLTLSAWQAWTRVIFLPRTTRSSKVYGRLLQRRAALRSGAFHSWTYGAQYWVRVRYRFDGLNVKVRAAFLSWMFRSWAHEAHHGARLAVMLAHYQSALATAQKHRAFRDWTLASHQLKCYCSGLEDSPFYDPIATQLPAVTRGVSHAAGFKGGGWF
jgi:hypothetical protein